MRISRKINYFNVWFVFSLISVAVGQFQINGKPQDSIVLQISTIPPDALNPTSLNQNKSALAVNIKNGSEISDLLQNTSSSLVTKITSPHLIKKKDSFELEESLKEDTENIQSTPNEKDRIGIVDKTKNEDFGEGEMAAIIAGIFLILSVVGYIGLISWRRFLERRYGNREMLVTEDDFNEPNGLQHFSI